MRRAATSYSCRRFTVASAASVLVVLVLAPATGYAQAIAALGSRVQRARAACDSAVGDQEYRAIRHDSGAVRANGYEMRMRVSKDSADEKARVGVEVMCRYDFTQGVARISRLEEGAARVAKPGSLTRAQVEAEQECKHSINSRPGYEVRRVGTPVADGAHAWVMSLVVRRDGEEDLRATCRYDAASGRVALRPR